MTFNVFFSLLCVNSRLNRLLKYLCCCQYTSFLYYAIYICMCIVYIYIYVVCHVTKQAIGHGLLKKFWLTLYNVPILYNVNCIPIYSMYISIY